MELCIHAYSPVILQLFIHLGCNNNQANLCYYFFSNFSQITENLENSAIFHSLQLIQFLVPDSRIVEILGPLSESRPSHLGLPTCENKMLFSRHA